MSATTKKSDFVNKKS